MSLVVGQNSLTPQGNNNMNFGHAHDPHMVRLCSLNPRQICELAFVKQMISLQVFIVLSWEV